MGRGTSEDMSLLPLIGSIGGGLLAGPLGAGAGSFLGGMIKGDEFEDAMMGGIMSFGVGSMFNAMGSAAMGANSAAQSGADSLVSAASPNLGGGIISSSAPSDALFGNDVGFMGNWDAISDAGIGNSFMGALQTDAGKIGAGALGAGILGGGMNQYTDQPTLADIDTGGPKRLPNTTPGAKRARNVVPVGYRHGVDPEFEWFANNGGPVKKYADGDTVEKDKETDLPGYDVGFKVGGANVNVGVPWGTVGEVAVDQTLGRAAGAAGGLLDKGLGIFGLNTNLSDAARGAVNSTIGRGVGAATGIFDPDAPTTQNATQGAIGERGWRSDLRLPRSGGMPVGWEGMTYGERLEALQDDTPSIFGPQPAPFDPQRDMDSLKANIPFNPDVMHMNITPDVTTAQQSGELSPTVSNNFAIGTAPSSFYPAGNAWVNPNGELYDSAREAEESGKNTDGTWKFGTAPGPGQYDQRAHIGMPSVQGALEYGSLGTAGALSKDPSVPMSAKAAAYLPSAVSLMMPGPAGFGISILGGMMNSMGGHTDLNPESEGGEGAREGTMEISEDGTFSTDISGPGGSAYMTNPLSIRNALADLNKNMDVKTQYGKIPAHMAAAMYDTGTPWTNPGNISLSDLMDENLQSEDYGLGTPGDAAMFTDDGVGYTEDFDVAGNDFGAYAAAFAEGGPVGEQQQPEQPNPIVQGAVAAITGNHPEPQAAIQQFVQIYGEEAFIQLRNEIVAAASADQRQASGLGALSGPGTGLSDDIPATIDGQQLAALSTGEHVFPADVVAHLGDGSTEAGSKRLQRLTDEIRMAKTGTKNQPKAIDPAQVLAKSA